MHTAWMLSRLEGGCVNGNALMSMGVKRVCFSLTAVFVLCGLNAQKTYNLVKKTKRDIKNFKAVYYSSKACKILKNKN